MSAARTFLLVGFLIFTFFYSSFQCKNFLDRAPELEFKKKFLEQSTEKWMAQLLTLNQKIALSQYYLLQMITYFSSFDLPSEHDHSAVEETGAHLHDSVDIKIRLVLQKYMLSHIGEFFDLDQYYALMSLVLEFDPHNDFARFFGLGFSINPQMTRGMCTVLENSFLKNPQWITAFDCGWLYFYILREYDQARLWLNRAKSFAGAPPKVHGIYAATLLLEKKYDIAIQDLMQQIQNCNNPNLISALEKRLHWYEALSLLYHKTIEYSEQFGKSVLDLSDLVKAGLLPAIPEDHLGSGFYWDIKHQEPASRNTYDRYKTAFAWESKEVFSENHEEHDTEIFFCPACHLGYKETVWAKKCEVWCRENNSCNLEITQHAIQC